MKSKQITGLYTSLTSGGKALDQSEVIVSSLIDAWLLLRVIEASGERNRGLFILKSRGMAHSNQIREFLLTDHGVELCDVFVGAGGVLTGSARLTQMAQDKAAQMASNQEIELRRIELERKRTTLEAQIAVLQAEFAVQEIASLKIIGQEKAANVQLAQDRVDMGLSRQADVNPPKRKASTK